MIIPLFNGILLDKIGDSVGLLTTSGIITLSQCITTYGVYINNFKIMLLGRFIYGLVGDTL